MLTDFRQHFYLGESECVFCGAFSPNEENDPCLSRSEIGKFLAGVRDEKRGRKIVNKREAESGVVVGG